MNKHKIEIGVHVLLLIFYFSAINVDWSSNWFDRSLRPNTPSPLSTLIFPIFFYVNAFILIPKYFSFEKWKQYMFFAFLLFILPEIIRCIFYTYGLGITNFYDELFSRDSFIFGSPNPFFLALNSSFIYRLTFDWLANKSNVEMTPPPPKNGQAYENSPLLTKEEIEHLDQLLQDQLNEKEIFLNPDLTLRTLANQIDTTEKKLSYLLNQHLDTNFYELLNKCRVEKFKTEALKPENQQLSIMGIAQNCGFQSKSSFYRAFKTLVGSSPSAYLKKIKNN